MNDTPQSGPKPMSALAGLGWVRCKVIGNDHNADGPTVICATEYGEIEICDEDEWSPGDRFEIWTDWSKPELMWRLRSSEGKTRTN